MTLWFAMAALTLAAALWLTRPFWQRGARAGVARKAANVAAFESRLGELSADIDAGVLPAEEAEALKREMRLRLVDAAAASAPTARATGHRARGVAVLLTLAVAVFAGVWYWQAGSWRTAGQIASGGGGKPDDAEVDAMVAKLAARLEANPDDADGFAMLGRSYFVMGRHADAAAAYAQANRISQSSKAAWLVDEGEALALSRERDLLGRPAQLFEAALRLEPGYGKALWYGSLADAQAENFARARQRLQTLAGQELPEALKTLVLARLDELRTLAGDGGAPPLPEVAAGRATRAGLQLTVQIDLAPSLAKQLPANATLFVFAKAAQGPPMPLAVQKLPGAKLPLTVVLDDSMAMTPALKLSGFERYVITARLSATGNASAAVGDLEGSIELDRQAAARGPAVVEIDRIVKP